MVTHLRQMRSRTKNHSKKNEKRHQLASIIWNKKTKYQQPLENLNNNHKLEPNVLGDLKNDDSF